VGFERPGQNLRPQEVEVCHLQVKGKTTSLVFSEHSFDEMKQKCFKTLL
jgi:hypothetical protein